MAVSWLVEACIEAMMFSGDTGFVAENLQKVRNYQTVYVR